MKRLLVIGFLLMSVGCKKEKGDKGDPGTPGTINTYEGIIASDNQTIAVSTLGADSQLSVYLGDAFEFAELPYYLPAHGVNTYFLANQGANTVQIINGDLAGATNYKIVVINAASGAGLSRLLR